MLRREFCLGVGAAVVGSALGSANTSHDERDWSETDSFRRIRQGLPLIGYALLGSEKMFVGRHGYTVESQPLRVEGRMLLDMVAALSIKCPQATHIKLCLGENLSCPDATFRYERDTNHVWRGDCWKKKKKKWVPQVFEKEPIWFTINFGVVSNSISKCPHWIMQIGGGNSHWIRQVGPVIVKTLPTILVLPIAACVSEI
jgi:hypothetical protein